MFRKRARTPPKVYKQQELSDYLAMQIDRKNRERLQTKQERDYLEKMEQLHLAEEYFYFLFKIKKFLFN